MHSRFRMKGVLLAALVAIVASVALPGVASAEPQPGAKKKGFRLFARALGAMTTNRVYCGLAADGRVCVDSTNSSTIGGGFWPKGTADQYVFNSGLQVAGIISNPGGVWDGDTVGGFFFDPKGTTEHGEQIMPLFNSSQLNAAGADADGDLWPEAACVPNSGNDVDGDLFFPLLQTGTDSMIAPGCRIRASQGDVWFLSWEGNPNLTAGRRHPLGVAVETRGMGWNYPSGNEDIIYFIYSFYNITSKNRADYNGIRPTLADILYAKALDFHEANLARGVDLPDGGYTINNLFAAFSADMDVAEAGSNFSGVNLPFALGHTYDQTFSQPGGWTFDPSIFSAPFFNGAGFVGVKYLKSPTGAGAIQLFGNTINGGAFGDARDVVQLYRYLSGNISQGAGDAPCNHGNPAVTHICFVNNSSAADMRFFQSSTSLSLAPGGRGSIVVAYIFAAPVATGSCPGTSCNPRPGDGRMLTSVDTLVTIGANAVDSISGFVSYADLNNDDIVQQGEFTVVPGSLLGKALTAQAVFDAKFLLPFAPDAPEFFLIPGNNLVTVLWKPSPSEVTGDPYFAVANAALVPNSVTGVLEPNALYDPNYRQNDVEGYRVYRGRVDAPNELTLLAQFDYTGTVISDFTGIINAAVDCAPEFNVGVGTTCPAAFPAGGNTKDGTTLTASVDYELLGDIIQVQAGKGRIPLADGTAFTVKPDTAVTGGGTNGGCGPRSACPALSNDGVPFVYVDATPRNNFRYFYSVTAFDVNSIESGPTSLESPRNTKPVTPVRPASNNVSTAVLVSKVVGRGGMNMDSAFPTPQSINSATGTFNGPAQPANGAVLGFVGQFAKEVVGGPGALRARLDSVQMGQPKTDVCCGGGVPGIPSATYWTAYAGTDSFKLSLPVQNVYDHEASSGALFAALSIDSSLASRYGGNNSYRLQAQMSNTLPEGVKNGNWGQCAILGTIGCAGTDFTGTGTTGIRYNGLRWFDGPSPQNNETAAHPTAGNCGAVASTAACSNAAAAATNFQNAGTLTGVTTVYQPLSGHMFDREWRNIEFPSSTVRRAGDFNVYWGAGGVVDSVIDVTHNISLPFDGNFANVGWGILNTSDQGAGSFDGRATVLSPLDWVCVEPYYGVASGLTQAQATFFPCAAPAAFPMSNTAELGLIALGAGSNQTTSAATNPKSVRVATNQQPNGGFSMYIAGTISFFEMTALPAAGTVWTMRNYSGVIYGGQGVAGDYGPYAYREAVRPFTAVGAEVQVAFDVTNAVQGVTASNLKQVHTVPDPYYVTNGYEQSTDNKVIKFVNLPRSAIVRIYSSSGVLVNVLEHNSNTFGGEMTWNVRNRNNQVVASGVYFYHIESNDGGSTAKRTGRMTIVNFAQ